MLPNSYIICDTILPKRLRNSATKLFYIIFSYSWGYRKVFEQYSGILQQKYRTLTIEGDNYPPPNWRLQLAQTLVSLSHQMLIFSMLVPFRIYRVELALLKVAIGAFPKEFYQSQSFYFYMAIYSGSLMYDFSIVTSAFLSQQHSYL